jgi:CrcB protein
MVKILLVGAGGFLGSVLRYLTAGLAHRIVPASFFPVGTLAANVIGCFAIGALAGAAESRGIIGAQTRLFLMIGLLGGYTTFSTFGFETLSLARDGETFKAVANIVLSVVLGLAAVWIGYGIARS